MFTELYRFYRSIEMGVGFAMMATQTEGRPDLLRAYVLAEMAAAEPVIAFETAGRELPVAA